MNMEFLYVNEINTTSMMSVTTGTDTAQYLFDRRPEKQYQSSGDASDSTATTIDITFSETITTDRILLQNMNLKDFTIYYNATTTNQFVPQNALTATSDWSSNSETSLYLYLSSLTAITSLSIVASATIVSAQEKKIGQLWINSQITQLPNNPDSKGYKAALPRKEFPHSMSDGGTALYVLQENYKADVKLSYQGSTITSALKDLYDLWSPFVVTPFPTGTSWDSKTYEVVWVGVWDFEQYSDNYITNGTKGILRLRETPK